MQACTNAWLLFRWWLQAIVARVNVEVELLESRSVAPKDGTAEGALLAGLKAELRDLQALRRRNRAQWMRALSAHLMKQCAEGKRGVAVNDGHPYRCFSRGQIGCSIFPHLDGNIDNRDTYVRICPQ